MLGLCAVVYTKSEECKVAFKRVVWKNLKHGIGQSTGCRH